jgi:hypothetical protein
MAETDTAAVPAAERADTTPKKMTWRAYLDTEEASRVIYLIFGLLRS